MGNKFFDGVIFQIPQICTKGSYMGEKAEEYGVGVALEPVADNFADEVFRYFNSIDDLSFNRNCDLLLKKVIYDYERTVKCIRKNIC